MGSMSKTGSGGSVVVVVVAVVVVGARVVVVTGSDQGSRDSITCTG